MIYIRCCSCGIFSVKIIVRIVHDRKLLVKQTPMEWFLFYIIYILLIYMIKFGSLTDSFKWTVRSHMSHDELPKVIDKSQADIDAAIAAIKASEIEGSTK